MLIEAVQGVSMIETDLGQKNIGKLLFMYSMPAIIATAATSIYNIVDRIFIGQIVGPLALSGITIAVPLMVPPDKLCAVPKRQQ